MKFESKTAENVQLLYQALASLRNFSISNDLTSEEENFLDFFSHLSFTAHHSTPLVSLFEITQSGALMSLKEREKNEPVHNSNTGGPARQNFIYCTLGVDGKFISPGFIGHDKEKITFTLPLKRPDDQKQQKNSCFQQVISALSISNHDEWFYKEARTDPIKINDVTRYIQFTKKDKLYIYHNQKTGEIWQRKVARHQELFYVQNDFSEISHVLGLQFLIELYSFKGDFCLKILKNPHENRSIITHVFQQLFPSQIYPEIQIKGKIPLDTFPGLVIQHPDKQLNELIAIAEAIDEQNFSEVLPIIKESLPLDASIETSCFDAHNLVTLAASRGLTDMVLRLARLGARLQILSLSHHSENILTVSVRILNYYTSVKNYLWWYECLIGFSQQFIPEVTQQFDLSRLINKKYTAFAALLILCWPNPRDGVKDKYNKAIILEFLAEHIKIYDPWVGLIASTYYCFDKNFQNKDNLLPILDWLLEQKCNINLPDNVNKESLWELAEENKDSAVIEWAKKNGAIPVMEKYFTFSSGKNAVGGIVFTEYKDKTRVLLVEKPHYWCGPGGLVDSGENSFDALLREINEETALDLSESKFESTARYRFQVEKDHYRRDLYYLKLHGNKLPWVKAEDDVADVQWALIDELDFKTYPVLYRGKPVLTSNSLLIQAKTSGIPEESSIETALYYESKYGQEEFERELSLGDLRMIHYVIPKGIILAETEAANIAARHGNKLMLEKLLAICASKFTTIDSAHAALVEAYKLNRKFAVYLIKHHQAEWRTLDPSFISFALMRLDFILIKYLFSRHEKLSYTFFNHCIAQFVVFKDLSFLKILLSFYPEQSAVQFRLEDNLVRAAQISFPAFEFLFLNGKAEISKNLLKRLEQIKILEDARQHMSLNFPMIYNDPTLLIQPVEKSPSIYLVMDFIDKLSIASLKKPDDEIKSYQIRLMPPPSTLPASPASTTEQQLIPH